MHWLYSDETLSSPGSRDLRVICSESVVPWMKMATTGASRRNNKCVLIIFINWTGISLRLRVRYNYTTVEDGRGMIPYWILPRASVWQRSRHWTGILFGCAIIFVWITSLGNNRLISHGYLSPRLSTGILWWGGGWWMMNGWMNVKEGVNWTLD